MGKGMRREGDEPSSSRASGVSSSSESGYWKVLRRRAWVRDVILWVGCGRWVYRYMREEVNITVASRSQNDRYNI